MSTFNPLDYPICVTRPLRAAPSTWIQHVPFAMLLIDMLRPETVVELGTFYGVSYCAFCQAAKELRTGTRLYGVDTWQGDPHSGLLGGDVLQDLREHHDSLYADSSEMVQSTFDDASGRFAAGSIDLLHIDGFHTYDACKHDFDNWLPKMSNRGVVIMHDISVRDRDFGVWKVFDELKPSYPHFSVAHGNGLGLLAVGEQYPAALNALVRCDAAQATLIERFLHRIGVTAEALRDAEMQLESLQNSRAYKLGRTLAAPLRKVLKHN